MMNTNSIIILGFFVCFSVVYSCTMNEDKDDEEEPAVVTDSFIPDSVLPGHTDLRQAAGYYEGAFPCKDCEGLLQCVLLKPDGTYKQAYDNADSGKFTRQTRGTWNLADGRVVLTESNQSQLIFDLVNDDLMASSISGIKIRDPSKYVLRKKPFAGTDAQNTEKSKNIFFRAQGTEPFWTLRIGSGTISFKLADWKNELVSRYDQMEKVNDTTFYHLKSNGNEMSVTIIDLFCKDGMSDLMYEYAVRIRLNNTVYHGCGTELMHDK